MKLERIYSEKEHLEKVYGDAVGDSSPVNHVNDHYVKILSRSFEEPVDNSWEAIDREEKLDRSSLMRKKSKCLSKVPMMLETLQKPIKSYDIKHSTLLPAIRFEKQSDRQNEFLRVDDNANIKRFEMVNHFPRQLTMGRT